MGVAGEAAKKSDETSSSYFSEACLNKQLPPLQYANLVSVTTQRVRLHLALEPGNSQVSQNYCFS